MTLEDFDDGTDEPNRSEPADMGGGKSSGPQDLLNGPDDSAEQTDEPTGPRKLENVMSDNTETTHSVNESADKIVLKTQVKRGDGTRDQDKIDVKVKGNNPGPTVDKLARVLDSLDDMDVVNRLRETQPGESDE